MEAKIESIITLKMTDSEFNELIQIVRLADDQVDSYNADLAGNKLLSMITRDMKEHLLDAYDRLYGKPFDLFIRPGGEVEY